jgi:hypothetical protein
LVVAVGSFISFDGSRKSEFITLACSLWGDTARRFVGRWLRGSAEVGIEEGPGSDILTAVLVVRVVLRGRLKMGRVRGRSEVW